MTGLHARFNEAGPGQLLPDDWRTTDPMHPRCLLKLVGEHGHAANGPSRRVLADVVHLLALGRG